MQQRAANLIQDVTRITEEGREERRCDQLRERKSASLDGAKDARAIWELARFPIL